MPDGIDLNSLLNEAAGGEPTTSEQTDTTSTEVETEPAEGSAPASESTDSTVADQSADTSTTDQTSADTTKTETKTEPKANKPNPMKEVRDKLNAEQKSREHIEQTIQRLTDGDYDFKLKDFKDENGKVDYEALTKAMDEKDNEKKAAARGVTPEIQAEVDRIEREKLELQKERLKVSMDRAISNLQIDMTLNKQDINKFFADALAVQKNPYQWLAQGGSLGDLYYLIYRDTLTKSAVDKAVAEAQEKWNKSASKKAPASNPASGSVNVANQDGLSLDQLLNEATKSR